MGRGYGFPEQMQRFMSRGYGFPGQMERFMGRGYIFGKGESCLCYGCELFLAASQDAGDAG